MKKSPPGRLKIMAALRELLQSKEFSLITTSEIAKTAGVTEGLIYKYFDDKQELLFEVLEELFDQVIIEIEAALSESDDPIEQFKRFISASFRSYAKSKVFSRIILLEVRKSERFFKSGAYGLVKHYSDRLLQIIQAGVEKGVFNAKINPRDIRNTVLGAIEHASLHNILFEKPFEAEKRTESLCNIVFNGIQEGVK